MTGKNIKIPEGLKKTTIDEYYDSNEETGYIGLNEKVRNIIYNEVRIKVKNIKFENKNIQTIEQINEQLEDWLFDGLEYVSNLESEEKTVDFIKIIDDIEKYPIRWMKGVIDGKILKAELLIKKLEN